MTIREQLFLIEQLSKCKNYLEFGAGNSTKLVIQKAKILIHDFFNRLQYFVVLPFLKLEDRVNTMGLFTIKKAK